MFPGSYASINGVNATVKILETSNTPMEEEDWKHRIDETMKLFTVQDLDMIALYFEQVLYQLKTQKKCKTSIFIKINKTKKIF